MSGNHDDLIARAKVALPLPDLMRSVGLGEYAQKSARSPFRNGDNPSAFGIFQKSDGTWNWKDFVTGEFGDEIDLVGKVYGLSNPDAVRRFIEIAGVQRPQPAPSSRNGQHEPPPPSPRLPAPAPAPQPVTPPPGFDWPACVEAASSQVDAVAAWRGLSTDFVEGIRAAGLLGFFTPHWSGAQPCVAFPVHAPGGEVVGCHYRLNATSAAALSAVSATSPRKRTYSEGEWMYTRGTRAAPLVIGDPGAAPGDVHVFESQWDALAVLDRLGWAEGRVEAASAIVTRGAANGKLVGTLSVHPDASVYLWPQNDAPKADGSVPSEQWFAAVRDVFADRPIRRVHTPAPHKDANDWVRAEGDERALHFAIAQAKRPRTSALPMMRDLSTILGPALPPEPPQVVHGLLHQGSKLIIGGTSKGRKTFSLLDLAISVQAGAPWWGRSTTAGRVCYINFEIQEAFFARRIEAIANAKRTPIQPGMLMGWTLRGHVDGIEKMAEDLMADLLEEQFSLIIFDPIYKALGDRDENKAGDVASMLNELESIAVRTGAAVAFGAHYSKGNQAAKESIDRIGGSGVFARDPDSILTMTPHEEEDCLAVQATLRNFAPIEPFVIRWEYPLFKPVEHLDPSDLRQSPGGRPKADDSPFLEKLTHPMTFTDWFKQLDPDLYSRSSFKNAVARMSKGGLIVKDDDGRWIKTRKGTRANP